jgi:ABC-type nitrate/sulfonate/bicarbonate transport system substrate-binding protein
MAKDLTKKLKEAQSLAENNNTKQAAELFEAIIKTVLPDTDDEEQVRAKENAIYGLSGIYKSQGQFSELLQLTKWSLPNLLDMPKSKMAKIVRTLFD